jgi:cysteine-rich repeat protein
MCRPARSQVGYVTSALRSWVQWGVRAVVAIVMAMATVGCIRESLQRCGNLVCAPDAECRVDHCVPRAALIACDGLANAVACSTPQLVKGVCAAGACIAPGCGNGVVESGEVCDDGNTVDGDGCSHDCEAIDICPPIGVAPRFSSTLHQSFAQECFDDTTSTARGWAIARCFLGGTQYGVWQGPIDGDLRPIANLSDSVALSYSRPRLAPEGDELYIVTYTMAGAFTLWSYGRNADDTWSALHKIAVPNTTNGVGMPSRGPSRRVLVTLADGTVHELAVAATGTSTDIATYTAAQLGVPAFFSAPDMSADGLRMTFDAYNSDSQYVDFYSDRSDPANRFRVADDLGSFASSFLVDNCARIYFSAANSVLYVEQGIPKP